MFSIDDAAPHKNPLKWFLDVRCPGVECVYLVSLSILLLMHYYHGIITSNTGIFMSVASQCEQ